MKIYNRLGTLIFDGADLTGADLIGADLRGADLRGANLLGANILGANLDSKVISINGSRHFFFYFDGNVSIGCEFYSLEYWLIMYEKIGNDNEYTSYQIKEYKKYLDFCKEVN